MAVAERQHRLMCLVFVLCTLVVKCYTDEGYDSNNDAEEFDQEIPQQPPPAFPNVPDVEGRREEPDHPPSRQNPSHSNYDFIDTLHTRYAPKDASTRIDGEQYILTAERLDEIRKEFLYWFFDMGGNDNNGDYQISIQGSQPQIHKNLNFQLPFFGFMFNYTRLSLNGYLEFSDPPGYYKYPLQFPNPNWPKENDPSFIGLFYSKCRIGKLEDVDIDRRKPGVYFRLERDLQARTDQMGVEMRERVMWDIREAMIGSDTFLPKHAMIATWKNVSFAGGIDSAITKTNTFQLVIATDEVLTYAIFNYLKIGWTTPPEAGGDTTGGEGGTPAYIGFNAGNGTQSWEYEPFSQASTVRDLIARGFANGFPGRHVFRIDEKIMTGVCNKDISGANLPLMFAPESGNMLGGTVVNVTGPCFNEGERIKCRFDTEEVPGHYVSQNRAMCVMPFVKAEGYINLEIALGAGPYNWKGKFYVETPYTAPVTIGFENQDARHEINPSELKILWSKNNLTMNANARVQVSLWGYREISITPELIYIDLLEESIPNTGVYTITPSNYFNRENPRLRDLEMGLIMINLTNPGQHHEGLLMSPKMWSKPIPLAWYFHTQWKKYDGEDWIEYHCNEWIKKDRGLKNFAATLPMCPCKLNQALSDKGRFAPDFDCDKDSNPDCYYHKGAVHCVRTGIPSRDGSEQQCCYDKNEFLMMTYDQQWGSNPHRSHNLGVLPWFEANKMPTLSHFYHDMIPLYFCCLWQHEQSVGCETFRFERRPTQDCVAYQPPVVGTVFGDPHFITFDDLEYTFNGKGEFVLVHVDTVKHKLDVQGRFEQIEKPSFGDGNATLLTAIAARDNRSAIVEVRVRNPIARSRYNLDVLVNSRTVFFDRPSQKIQHFPGVTVYTPSHILNQSEVIIMFESGAGVEVIESKGYITCRVYLPMTFANQTRGLLGNWSFDATDDFTLPNGATTSAQVNNLETIHRSFAMYWLLEDKEEPDKGASLFIHDNGRSASYFAERDFRPEYNIRPEDILPPNRTQDINYANAMCGDSYQCKYDYSVSLSRDLAFYSKNFMDDFTVIKKSNLERILSCGVLETPKFGRKSTFEFTPGTKVAFECNVGFVLIGDVRRSCQSDGRWSALETGETRCLSDAHYSQLQAGVTMAIVMGILIPMFLVIMFVMFKLIKNSKQKNATDGNRVKRRPSISLSKTGVQRRFSTSSHKSIRDSHVDETEA